MTKTAKLKPKILPVKSQPLAAPAGLTSTATEDKPFWVKSVDSYEVPGTLLFSGLALAVSIIALWQTGSMRRIQKRVLKNKLHIYLRDVESFLEQLNENAAKLQDPEKNRYGFSIPYPTLMLENFPITPDDILVLASISKDSDGKKTLMFLRSQVHVWYSQQATLENLDPVIHYPPTEAGRVVLADHKFRLENMIERINTALSRLEPWWERKWKR